DDPFGVPLWSERPRCRCGSRAWMVTIMDISDRNYGRRCFKCPDLDNDFMPCTFLEWIDTNSAPAWPRRVPVETETKGRYMVRMDEVREAERQAILERERQLRQQQIRLDGKDKPLNRRRDDLVAREIELKRREDDLKRRQDLLSAAEQRDTNYHGTSSSKEDRKGKNLRFTQ
ncbi:hypothetical protein BS78_05G007400, partial [Paspalum vaginatum]